MMKIVVNGQETGAHHPVTSPCCSMSSAMAGKRVAVEVNQEIVPRSRHTEFRLNDSDRVEVVFAIGGG